jgi:hypothetical protein
MEATMRREERQAVWADRVAAQAASGLSARAWCGQEDVNYWSFIQWRRRLGGEPLMAGPLNFVQVLPAEANASTVRVRVGAAWIEVGAGFDPALRRRVVDALG